MRETDGQEKAAEVFACFGTGASWQGAAPHGGGLINASWLVTTEGGPRFLLQRVNRQVFPHPRQLMENILRVTAHLRDRAEPTLEFLPLAADPAEHLHLDDQGEAWRLCRFIEGAATRTAPADAADAEAAGRAFGRFLRHLDGFPATTLHATLPGFHDTPSRWAALLQAHHDDPCGRAWSVEPEMAALWAAGDLAQGLVRLDLPVRVVHNDAKLANVLLDPAGGPPLGVVDLDTVMPGSALHDFGDMVRTMCCTADEEETWLEGVEVDPDLLAALAAGWLAEAEPVLTFAERDHLLPAGLVITFEQAARYLTDHLRGDLYYRTSRPDHNLDRCRNQLRLLSSLICRRGELAAVLP